MKGRLISRILNFLKNLSSGLKIKLRTKQKKQKQKKIKNQTNHKVWERALWLVYPSACVSDSDNLVFTS